MPLGLEFCARPGDAFSWQGGRHRRLPRNAADVLAARASRSIRAGSRLLQIAENGATAFLPRTFAAALKAGREGKVRSWRLATKRCTKWVRLRRSHQLDFGKSDAARIPHQLLPMATDRPGDRQANTFDIIHSFMGTYLLLPHLFTVGSIHGAAASAYKKARQWIGTTRSQC